MKKVNRSHGVRGNERFDALRRLHLDAERPEGRSHAERGYESFEMVRV